MLESVKIVALGDRDPTYLTHREIDAALELFPEWCERGWVPTDSIEARELDQVDAVWLLPGTPYRDDAVAYAGVRHCLDSGKPFLGTCGGFQYACVELARRFAHVTGAAHAETDPEAEDLVVVPLRCSLYGERRLVRPVSGSRLASICGSAPFEGFHYCGYGIADAFAQRLADAGVVISAYADDAGVEGVELPNHPFFLATAFQPQVGASESDRLHPLLEAFLAAAEARSSVDNRRASPSRASAAPRRC
jgi:CTP synthase (UTP-ammonia lyase)